MSPLMGLNLGDIHHHNFQHLLRRVCHQCPEDFAFVRFKVDNSHAGLDTHPLRLIATALSFLEERLEMAVKDVV